jgi:hypothetical protein
VLQHLHPEHVEVEICLAEELAQRRGFCRKFCSEGHNGAVAPVCAEITRRESRTVRPQ